MAHKIEDRVRDTTTSTGTGAIAVTGTPPTAYRAFSAVCAAADTIWIVIVHRTANEWEVSLATSDGALGLTRTSVLSSSNGGLAVSFSAGTKDVIAVHPASAIYPFVFTSAAIGLVPASGGGTTNFLRADGTWTTAAGGVDTQVQFNDGGAFGGDSGLVYNKDDNTLTITTTTFAPNSNDNSALQLSGGFGGGLVFLDTASSGIWVDTAGTFMRFGVGGSAAGIATHMSLSSTTLSLPVTLTMTGATSGAVTIQPQAVAGTWNFNLPTTAGSAGQVLTSQGGGATAMTWETPSGSNAFGTIQVSGQSDVVADAAPDILTLAAGSAITLTTNAATDTITIAVTASTFQPLDTDLTSWALITRAAGFDTFVATPTSANLDALVTDDTGSGALVFATSPTLVTPLLGTPTSGVLTNCTGLPTILVANEATDTTCFPAFFTAATGELGPKTNANLTYNSNTGAMSIGTTAALTVGTIELGAASDTTLSRASAGVLAVEGVNVLTTATGQPLDADLTSWALITRAAGFDTFVATPSSANLLSLVTDETGTGALVFANTPSLITPKIADSAGGQFYNFAVSNLVADRTVTLPLLTGNDTFVFEAHTQTLTNKTINLSSNTLSGTTAQFNTANSDADFYVTGGTDVAVADGGTGASTLTGLLQGNGTSAITGITNSSTVGQVLRVTGASTYAWGALDLADTDAITGDLPYANLTPSANASRLLGRQSGSAGDWEEITLGTNLSMSGTTLNATAGAGGYATIQEEGSGLTARTTLNFVGGGFTAADDGANTRTNVTLDTTLNALAAYNTNGLLTQTAADTFAGRTITGTTAQITVTDGDGVAGNPVLSFPSDILVPTVLTVPNTGLHLLDTDATHDLIVKPGSNLTADRTLTITTGDTDMIVNLTAVTDEFVLAYDTGTNTWRGVAATGGTPTLITVANEATDTTCFVAFFTAATGDLGPKTNANLTFNSSTGALGASSVTSGGNAVLTTATGQPLDADLTSWALITRAAGFDTFATTPSSANLISLVSDETGTGALVFANTPSLITPKIADSAGGQFYNFAVSNLAADRTVTLPLLTAGDTFVFEAHTQTLTNKTISLTNNTVSGTATEFNSALSGADFYTTGGTDVALADGGTGTSLTDPNLDRIMFWDDSAGVVKFAALADITTEASPTTGDMLLAYDGTTDQLIKVNWSSLPGVGSGISGSGTDEHVMRWNGTANAQDSTATLTDDGKLTVNIEDAAAATVLYAERLTRTTTHGTPANGIGVGMEFEVETAAGNNEVGATIEAVTTDVTGASEDFKLVFKTMQAGSLLTALDISRLGVGAFLDDNSLLFNTTENANTGGSAQMQHIVRSGTDAEISLVASHSGGQTRLHASDGYLIVLTETAEPILFYTNNTGRGSIASTGEWAIGNQAADRLLHVEQETATTNAVTYVQRLTSTSSGTPAAGIGVGVEFEVETSSANNEIAGTIEAVLSDVTGASEDSDLLFRTLVAGTSTFASYVPRTKRLNNVHSVTGVTGTEITELEFPGVQPGTYVVEYWLIFQSGTATTGLGIGLNFTGTAAVKAFMRYDVSTITTASNGLTEEESGAALVTGGVMNAWATQTYSTATPTTMSEGVGSTTLDMLMRVEGVVIVTAAGDLEIWHSSQIAATTTTIRVGSSARLTRTA